jgi:hypothetical protein
VQTIPADVSRDTGTALLRGDGHLGPPIVRKPVHYRARYVGGDQVNGASPGIDAFPFRRRRRLASSSTLGLGSAR